MASAKQIHRELAELARSLGSTFDGQVILPEEPLQQREEGETTLAVLQFAVKPNDGIYSDCRVNFEISFRDGYPDEKPEINCTDVVAHPNIGFDSGYSSDSSNVCVSILDDWTDGECRRDMSSLVQAVLFLFYNPEVDDALVTVGDLDELKELVEATKRGTKLANVYCEFSGLVFTDIYEGPASDIVENDGKEESEKTTQAELEQRVSVKTDADTVDVGGLDATNVIDRKVEINSVMDIKEGATSVVTDEEKINITPEEVTEKIPASAVREETSVTAVADPSQEEVVNRCVPEIRVMSTVDDVTEKMTDSLIMEREAAEAGKGVTKIPGATTAVAKEALDPEACDVSMETREVTIAEEERRTVAGGEFEPEDPTVGATAVRESAELTEATEVDVIVALPISDTTVTLSLVVDRVGQVDSDFHETNVTRKVLRKAVYSLWRRLREFLTRT